MNLDDIKNIQDLSWVLLDDQLNAKCPEDFERQFKRVFSCPKAKTQENKGVVYVWVAEKRIPRLCGESDIVYIGKTNQTLHGRYHKYASLFASIKGDKDKYNWRRYEHIMKNFGPIKIYFSVHSDPKEKEAELLRKYYDSHFEYPPANSASS
ncbi:MAG: hypothetical protein PHW62_01890 [Candidatus Ratteibacteria bacterium]|nr:hypothetical protein [Candidatus Ratteibacteria bacterium]